jgi:NlpC/P60 family
MSHVLALLAGLSTLASPPLPRPGPPSDPFGTANATASVDAAAQVSTTRKMVRGGVRARLVSAARRHVGKRFGGDCTGFVRRVYAEAGVPLPSGVSGRSASESIFRSLTPVRKPRRGDLAFFHRTYDREAPGPGRNRFTHVAVVESVESSRVSLIHRGSKGIQRFTMNLAHPADPDENGALRHHRPGDSPKQRYLASELFAGFASALGSELRAGRGSQRGRHERSAFERTRRALSSPPH